MDLTSSQKEIVNSSHFKQWARGIGVIKHTADTQNAWIDFLGETNISAEKALPLLMAADTLCNQAMWLVVHMTYAKNVYLDGRPLNAADFKQNPQGHTGGSLNMVPAYIGYLLANAISDCSRQWIMGQGHCVAAIDATNLLVQNSLPHIENRYPLSDQGLSRFVRDFYGYRITAEGRPESLIGSHCGVNTAGARIEGGYLGFAGLHYVHQPLPGERLVAFLSDGAFEEQRGSDWSARWWREKDTGLVMPIMIANGRRIDQRTTCQQLGGSDYLSQHLKLHHFEPKVFDGRDPAAFCLQILKQEQALQQQALAITRGDANYPVRLPYGIAETEKGFGFYGAGTNAAHGTPLPANPATDKQSRHLFNHHAEQLFIPQGDWQQACDTLNNHSSSAREKERYILASRVEAEIPNIALEAQKACSPMQALDACYLAIVKANPELRARVANPDELDSNRFSQTLKHLKHRVTQPESGAAEDIHGSVITALNEEAVVSAILANQAGINIAVSYEAFANKMIGALRQQIIFTRHKKEQEQPIPWLSIPIIATSHLWENGKNEQSHQDSSFCEAMMAEMSDTSRVIFPADASSAVQYLSHIYQSHGQICSLVVPKSQLPIQFTQAQAKELVDSGALRLLGNGSEAIQIVAIGAFQLLEAQKACLRLAQSGHATSLVYLAEPGKYRTPRDAHEQTFCASQHSDIFGSPTYRLLVCHGRPEYFLGLLRPLDLGPDHCRALGYINRGGTLDTQGMLFANKLTWAHMLYVLSELAPHTSDCLSQKEREAVNHKGDPYTVIPEPYTSG